MPLEVIPKVEFSMCPTSSVWRRLRLGIGIGIGIGIDWDRCFGIGIVYVIKSLASTRIGHYTMSVPPDIK